MLHACSGPVYKYSLSKILTQICINETNWYYSPLANLSYGEDQNRMLHPL